MTTPKQSTTGNKAIIEWIFDNYSCNPRYIAEENAKKEARNSSAIIQLALANNATLLRCRATGQPVGQLFDHAIDTIVPATVAPTWLAMPKDTEDRLAQAPLATTVYIITRVLTGDALVHYLGTGGMSAVQQIDIEAAFLSSVYDAIVHMPKVAPIIFVAINDLIRRFGSTEQTRRAVFLTAQGIEGSKRIEEVLTPIADVWESMIQKHTGKVVSQDAELVRVEQLAQETIHNMNRPTELNPTLSNLLVRPTPVKKTNKRRADVAVHREVSNELSEGIAALFANANKMMQADKERNSTTDN